MERKSQWWFSLILNLYIFNKYPNWDFQVTWLAIKFHLNEE